MSDRDVADRFFKSSVFQNWGQQFLRPQIPDKIDLPSLLYRGLLLIQYMRSQGMPEFADDAIMLLLDMIPPTWKDEAFQQELNAAYYEYEIDTYPTWGGITQVWNKQTVTESVIDYSAILRAIMGLFDRINLLSRKVATEVLEPEKYANDETIQEHIDALMEEPDIEEAEDAEDTE